MSGNWASFKAYHAANPHIYDRLVAMALALKSQGFERYGMAGLFEVIRYEQGSRHGVKFKIDNYFRAAYARHIMQTEPRLAGFFTTRRSVLDDDQQTQNAGRAEHYPKRDRQGPGDPRINRQQDVERGNEARCPYARHSVATVRPWTGSSRYLGADHR